MSRKNTVDPIYPTCPDRPFFAQGRSPIRSPTYAGSVTVFDSAAQQQTSPETAATTAPRARTAAFFDLDKTIIAKSSTLAFSKPFFDQGLLNRRAVLKSSYAQFIFLLSGADHDQMDRMRTHLANMCIGWDVEQVKSIDYRARKARRIGSASEVVLEEVLSILDACIY